MFKAKKVIAVLPAYNAAKTLTQTVRDIPQGYIDEIILVDDASSDETVKIAEEMGIKVFVHSRNLGYGGNQKTCYQEALQSGADIVVMLHPDHQYDPQAIPQLIEPLLKEETDAVFGSRMMNRANALSGGMPYWKYLANIFLTKVENFILGLKLTEYHSGFRAYSRKVLAALPLSQNSDDFVFDSEIIVQMKVFNFSIKEIPIQTSYFKEASQISFWPSLKYGLSIMNLMFHFLLFKLKLMKFRKFNAEAVKDLDVVA